MDTYSMKIEGLSRKLLKGLDSAAAPFINGDSPLSLLITISQRGEN